MATDMLTDDALQLGSHTFNSRLIVGTGKYASHDLMAEALDAAPSASPWPCGANG